MLYLYLFWLNEIRMKSKWRNFLRKLYPRLVVIDETCMLTHDFQLIIIINSQFSTFGCSGDFGQKPKSLLQVKNCGEIYVRMRSNVDGNKAVHWGQREAGRTALTQVCSNITMERIGLHKQWSETTSVQQTLLLGCWRLDLSDGWFYNCNGCNFSNGYGICD